MLGRFGGGGKFWPDVLPVSAQLLARDLAGRGFFNGNAVPNRNRPRFIHPLVEEAGRDINRIRQGDLRMSFGVLL